MPLDILNLIFVATKLVLNIKKKEKLQLINYDIKVYYQLNWLGFLNDVHTCCCVFLAYVYSCIARLGT